MDNYILSSSVNEGIVELIITGELAKQDVARLHVEAIKILRDHDARAVLADVRSARGPNDVIDAYHRARSIPHDISILPLAVVDRQEDTDFRSFYETTAANTGQLLKWFTDIEEAREWIKSKLEK